MSRYDDIDEIERRIYRGVLVAQYHKDVSVLDYIRAEKGLCR